MREAGGTLVRDNRGPLPRERGDFVSYVLFFKFFLAAATAKPVSLSPSFFGFCFLTLFLFSCFLRLFLDVSRSERFGEQARIVKICAITSEQIGVLRKVKFTTHPMISPKTVS